MKNTDDKLRAAVEQAVQEHIDTFGVMAPNILKDSLLSALSPILADRERDAARLDWLDRNRYMVDFNNEGTELNGPGHWGCTDGNHWGEGLHVRAAIDAAQRADERSAP